MVYIPLTVVERTPRCRRKTKGANFLSSIWLLNLDVMAVDTEGQLFYSGGSTAFPGLAFNQSAKYYKSGLTSKNKLIG